MIFNSELKKSHWFLKIYLCYGGIILETGGESFPQLFHVVAPNNLSLLPVKAAISARLKNMEIEFSTA